MPEHGSRDWRDDLLKATVADTAPPVADPKRRPWRLASQFYVAFFGGPIAATIVAFENARRLAMPERSRWLIVAMGVLATVLAVGFACWWIARSDAPGEVDREVRMIPRGVAVGLFGLFYLLQRMPDRLRQHREAQRGAEPYASLWSFGFGAVVIGGLAQAGCLILTVAALGIGPQTP